MFIDRLIIVFICALWSFEPSSAGFSLLRKQKKKRKCVDANNYCHKLKEEILDEFPGIYLEDWNCKTKKERNLCPVFCGVCKQVRCYGDSYYYATMNILLLLCFSLYEFTPLTKFYYPMIVEHHSLRLLSHLLRRPFQVIYRVFPNDSSIGL